MGADGSSNAESRKRYEALSRVTAEVKNMSMRIINEKVAKDGWRGGWAGGVSTFG